MACDPISDMLATFAALPRVRRVEVLVANQHDLDRLAGLLGVDVRPEPPSVRGPGYVGCIDYTIDIRISVGATPGRAIVLEDGVPVSVLSLDRAEVTP